MTGKIEKYKKLKNWNVKKLRNKKIFNLKIKIKKLKDGNF